MMNATTAVIYTPTVLLNTSYCHQAVWVTSFSDSIIILNGVTAEQGYSYRYFTASANLRATESQLTTFHQFSTYSGRRF